MIKTVTILIMPAKLATPGLLEIKIFRNKDYDVIILDYDITNKILSRDSNYILDVARWTRNSWIWTVTRKIEIVTRNLNLWIWTRNSRIWTCTFEFQLVLLSFQLATRNTSLFGLYFVLYHCTNNELFY